MKPLLIAHRGDTVNHPENTIAAFQSAFDRGADGIEFDVQCHNSGDIVIVHNYTHDPKKVYPFLEDVLKRFSNHGRLEVEIKALEEDCVQKTSRVINKINPQDIEITSSELPIIPFIRKYFPETKVGIILQSCLIQKWMPASHIQRMLTGYMRLTGANVLHLDLNHYSEEIVTLLHDQGYLTHTHLPDSDVSSFKKVVDLGIDQCSFDDFKILEFKKQA